MTLEMAKRSDDAEKRGDNFCRLFLRRKEISSQVCLSSGRLLQAGRSSIRKELKEGFKLSYNQELSDRLEYC